jgi:hypothetical protein
MVNPAACKVDIFKAASDVGDVAFLQIGVAFGFPEYLSFNWSDNFRVRYVDVKMHGVMVQ